MNLDADMAQNSGSRVGIIGGTGLHSMMAQFEFSHQQALHTSYGVPSSELTYGSVHGKDIVFIARHGVPHRIAPHKVNYRANIRALKEVGVDKIIALNAVGSMHPDAPPEALVIPHQIIDYSYGRKHSYFAEDNVAVEHIDFTRPYSESLRKVLLQAGENLQQNLLKKAVYACTQGPRLETAAEITRLSRDGCDIVGMTAMPEAALAREQDIEYASIALVANWAAGYRDEALSMAQIEQHVKNAAEKVHRLLLEAVRIL
jgi:5'-deoxy-5'-methylthioadenosine phosphorylase